MYRVENAFHSSDCDDGGDSGNNNNNHELNTFYAVSFHPAADIVFRFLHFSTVRIQCTSLCIHVFVSDWVRLCVWYCKLEWVGWSILYFHNCFFLSSFYLIRSSHSFYFHHTSSISIQQIVTECGKLSSNDFFHTSFAFAASSTVAATYTYCFVSWIYLQCNRKRKRKCFFSLVRMHIHLI